MNNRIPTADAGLLPGNAGLCSHGNSSPASEEPRGPRERTLTIRDVEGSYIIPYIRSDRDGYCGKGAGTVIAALGDSITEGYWGERFWRDSLDLRADMFPPGSVSRDGRNFPQYAPTTRNHSPGVNCFTSWMTRLNDRLSDLWHRPVFIANEGWGGITTAGYLKMMQDDPNWQDRMRMLEPSVWLIHLGVNDERAKIPAPEVAVNLNAIVDLLIRQYEAVPANIVLALPCYDYAPGATDILASYIVEIEGLIAARGLRRGPDFFSAYSVDKARYYGDDPVHPNVEGMRYMADLWAAALEQPPVNPNLKGISA